MKCSQPTVRSFSNPFATRFVAPGALSWIASPENSLPALSTRFEFELGRRAAIVGPHGSGKSTLLAQLVPLLVEVGWCEGDARAMERASAVACARARCVWLVLRRSRQQPVQQILNSRPHWSSGGLLILDGLEQLRSWEYGWVRLLLSAARMGLLATCHRTYQSLPSLINTTASPHTTQRLVAERLAGSIGLSTELKEQLADFRFIRSILAEEQGSVREVFMRLYDEVENQRGGPDTNSCCLSPQFCCSQIQGRGSE